MRKRAEQNHEIIIKRRGKKGHAEEHSSAWKVAFADFTLAMMALFGGFPDRVFDAYVEEFPPEPGWEERREFNQLVPVLVHCAMYGGKWITDADRILRSVT